MTRMRPISLLVCCNWLPKRAFAGNFSSQSGRSRAASLRARRRLGRTSSGRNCAGAGWKSKTSGERGPYGWLGCWAGPRSSCRVSTTLAGQLTARGPGGALVGFSDQIWCRGFRGWGQGKVAGRSVPGIQGPAARARKQRKAN